MAEKSKTISGHNGSGISLAHNNRDFIAKNVNVEMIKNNVSYVVAGKPAEQDTNVRFATLEEIYEKVFEPSWRDFQARQRSDRKSEYSSYLEELKAKRAEEDAKLVDSKKKHHKTKAIAYETVFQIGNQDDTNVLKHAEDSELAGTVLDNFARHLLSLPYVTVVTSKELEDPNWVPPGEAGILVYNFVMHGDEPDGCRHQHVDYIPYFKSGRGQAIQTGLGQTFKKLGFDSRFVEKLDDHGEKIPKKDKNGNIRRDKNGEIIYEKENSDAGVYDWIESQKEWIEDRMKEQYNWERDYQGERATPRHLDTPEYKAQREKEKREAEISMFRAMAESAEQKAEAAHWEAEKKIEEEQRRADAARAEADQVIQTTIQSKEEYVREVNSIKTFFINFFDRLADVVVPLINAKDEYELRPAVTKFQEFWQRAQESFGKIGLKIKNLLGFENKTNMPKEEREAPAVMDALNNAYERAEAANAQTRPEKSEKEEDLE